MSASQRGNQTAASQFNNQAIRQSVTTKGHWEKLLDNNVSGERNAVVDVGSNKSERDDGKSQSSSNFHVWDSRYGRPGEAFSIFRETICNTFMPWTPEVIGSPFEGRVESVSFEHGVVGRVRMTPIIAAKTKQNIANSTDECIHANFILNGELKVDQGGVINVAKPGDVVLYHSFSPVTLTLKPGEFFDNLAFVISRSEFASH